MCKKKIESEQRSTNTSFMDELKKLLDAAKVKIETYEETIATLKTAETETERKLVDICDNIQADYKEIIGSDVYNLRRDEWSLWRQTNSSCEYVDLLLSDFTDKIKLRQKFQSEEQEQRKQLILRYKELQSQAVDDQTQTDERIANLQEALKEAECKNKELRKTLSLHKELATEINQNTNADIERLTGALATNNKEIERLRKQQQEQVEIREQLADQLASTIKERDTQELDFQRKQRITEEGRRSLDVANRELIKRINILVNEETARTERIAQLTQAVEKERQKVSQLETYIKDWDEETNRKELRRQESLQQQAQSLANWQDHKMRNSQDLFIEDTGRGGSPCSTPNLSAPKRTLEELMVLTNRMVPTFSGGKSSNTTMELDKFLEGCMMAQEAVTHAEYPNLFRCIKKKLDGEAYQHVSINGCTDIDSLERLLKRIYKKAVTFDRCSADLRNCKQQPGEETNTFTMRAERLFRVACAAVDEKYNNYLQREAIKAELESTAIDTIRRGLSNKDIRKHILAVGAKSLQELVEEIERYDKGLEELSDPTNEEKAENIRKSVHMVEKDPISKLMTLMESTLSELKSNQNAANNRINRMEHLMSGQRHQERLGRPFVPGGGKRNDFRNRGQREENDNILLCFTCRQPGHFARECPNRWRRADPTRQHQHGTPTRSLCRWCGDSRIHNFIECKARFDLTHNSQVPTETQISGN